MKYSEFILASASKRRHELIKKLDYIKVRFYESNVNEIIIKNDAVNTALVNAKKKGLWALENYGAPVIACDTVVSLNNKVLTKPKSRRQAIWMFKNLCSNTHEVYTAVFVADFDTKIEAFEKTLVTFGAFDKKTVYDYIDSKAPFDKAGGYGIQDLQIKSLIKQIQGDYDNVVGLPVVLLDKIIKENF